MYSLGLPILFPILAVAMIISYWFNKVMLMRFYQKTYEFNEDLPMASMEIMKLAFLAHFMIGAVKLSMGKQILDDDDHFMDRNLEFKTDPTEFKEDTFWV
jgi:hypothetical protein